MKLWELLGEKGKIATIIGFFFASPANAWALWKLYKGAMVTIDQLWVVVVINIVGVVWFILPSAIIIRSQKLQIEIKD